MEHWIGTLIVILMVPGLLLIVGVVIGGLIFFKRKPASMNEAAESETPSLVQDVDA